METSVKVTTSLAVTVRFHLGSGINGNLNVIVFIIVSMLKILHCFPVDFFLVRFHLGSGINGNIRTTLSSWVSIESPLSSRKWN